MLEKTLIQTRGFHNIIENGEIVGFQFCIRLAYYRGIYMSQLRPQRVIVDGEVFPKEQVVWCVKGQDCTYEEMQTNSTLHWWPGEAAVLKVYKKGGLKPGYHTISAGYKYSSSYLPPVLQQDIDDEYKLPDDPLRASRVRDERKLLLVW